LTPNDPYKGRTAPLSSKLCILCIYSTNIGTEYFKHGIHSPFFSLQNAVCFIILTYLVPVLFIFYIQGVIKLKKYFRRQKVKHSRTSEIKEEPGLHLSRKSGTVLHQYLLTGILQHKNFRAGFKGVSLQDADFSKTE